MTAPTRSNRTQAPHREAGASAHEGAQHLATPLSEATAPTPSQRRLGNWIDVLAQRGLQLEVSFKSGATVLSLSGRLDQQSAGVLKDGFPDIVALTPRLIDVDLGGVSRVDGMGLAALVWSWGLAREQGRELRLLHMPAATRVIVAKMNLHHVLQIVEDGTFR